MFRKAIADDCKAVYNLICDLENRELPYSSFAEIFAEQVADNRFYCLLWETEGKIRAVLNLRFEGQLHHASRVAEVMEFSVDASCRGQGIGKQMFAEACRIAQEFGCSQIELATNQLRTDAHRFYAREGMNNFHYKFSKPFGATGPMENIIGR
jgi:PhnO protein